MNNDFCTKHNLSFCERELRNSQKRFPQQAKSPSAWRAAPGKGLGLSPCPLWASVSPLVKWAREDWIRTVVKLYAHWVGVTGVKSPIPGPSARVRMQGVWLSFKKLSRRGWGRALRATQAAGEKSSRPRPPPCPLFGHVQWWPSAGLTGAEGGTTPGCLCPLVARGHCSTHLPWALHDVITVTQGSTRGQPLGRD